MVIDAAAHPVMPTGEEIRDYMDEPWRSKFFPWTGALPIRIAVRRVP